MGGKVFRNTIAAIGHCDPILCKRANHVDIGKLRIIGHPNLCNSGTAHFQFLECSEEFVGAITIGSLAVACDIFMACHNQDNTAKFQSTVRSRRIQIFVESHFGFQPIVHSGILFHIPLSSLRLVGTALTPIVTHAGERIVSRSNFLQKDFLTSIHQGICFFKIALTRLPTGNTGSTMCSIYNPNLFTGLSCPFISKTAIHTVLAVTCFGKGVYRMSTQFFICAVHIDGAVVAGQGRRDIIARILHSQTCIAGQSIRFRIS